ncbi:MAG: zinc-ribbon domain-containing protein [Candidatus Woesearchaeota archaeon]
MCGNGKKDIDEDCMSCELDAGCGSSAYCYNGQCVDCIKDEHCATRDTPTGEFICSPDFRATLEKVVRKAGICTDHKCTGEEISTTKPGKQCGDMLCQDNHCGCNEGYQVCLATGKCEKTGALEDGSNCGCYHQCSSNYCSKEGKCMRALNTILSSEKDLISAGEDTTVTISADNTLGSDIPVKLTLNIDTGASMSGIIGGADCTGNQCTGGQIIVPAKGRTSVEVKIEGQSAGKVKLTSVITPIIEGTEYPKAEEIFITVIDADDGKCTEGETSSNACVDCGCPTDTRLHSYTCDKEENSCDKSVGWWLYVIIGILVLVIVLVYFGATKGKAVYARLASEREKRQAQRENAEKKEKLKEDADRKKVVKALYKIKIDINNPPTVHEIIKRLGMDADDDIIEEEYEQMLRRMEKKPRAAPEAKAEATAKTPTFCTKCGTRLKAGVKFCTKCGSVVKGR